MSRDLCYANITTGNVSLLPRCTRSLTHTHTREPSGRKMNLNELRTPRVINLMRCASEGTKPLRLQQHLLDLRCSVSPTRSIKCWYYVATNRRTNSYLGHANIVVTPPSHTHTPPHGTIWNLVCFFSLVYLCSRLVLPCLPLECCILILPGHKAQTYTVVFCQPALCTDWFRCTIQQHLLACVQLGRDPLITRIKGQNRAGA